MCPHIKSNVVKYGDIDGEDQRDRHGLSIYLQMLDLNNVRHLMQSVQIAKSFDNCVRKLTKCFRD